TARSNVESVRLTTSVCPSIESLPLLVRGKPRTKSIEMPSHGALGIGRGVYSPYGFKRDLALWHVLQRRTYRSTSLLILGQKK
ncbi:hypothetical protein U9M48_013728, partial [Paspalum notatum var. saurae]